MKNRIIATFTCLMFPLVAAADCGYIPAPPVMLQEAQLSSAQFSELEPQMESYFNAIETYTTCINDEISQLPPANATESYFLTPEYRAAFEGLNSKSDMALQRMTETTDRYNYLVEIGEVQ